MFRIDPLLALLLAAVAGIVTGCGADSAQPAPAANAEIPKNQNLPNASAPESKREPIPVEWERLEMPLGEDNHFEPWMVSGRVKELVGKRVRVQGFMYAGGLSQRGNIREFPLIRELGCEFGKGAPAWHVIMVELEGKRRTEYKAEQVTVEGILRVRPYNGTDGKTWSVYFLEGTNVE